jgi:hypothetical protein
MRDLLHILETIRLIDRFQQEMQTEKETMNQSPEKQQQKKA